MKGRKTTERIVLGFCALFVGIFLTSCGASKNSSRHLVPIGPSAGEVVSAKTNNPPTPRHRTTPEVIDLRKPGYKKDITELSSKQPLFGNYDREFIATVEKHWIDLVDQRNWPSLKGKVTVRFLMAFNGNISDIEVTTATANAQAVELCVKALQNGAPYPAWPAEMRREIGDKRVINFTFYYEQ